MLRVSKRTQWGVAGVYGVGEQQNLVKSERKKSISGEEV